jgi:hypothetical protein
MKYLLILTAALLTEKSGELFIHHKKQKKNKKES